MAEDSFEKARKAFFAPVEKAPKPSAPADEIKKPQKSSPASFQSKDATA